MVGIEWRLASISGAQRQQIQPGSNDRAGNCAHQQQRHRGTDHKACISTQSTQRGELVGLSRVHDYTAVSSVALWINTDRRFILRN